MSRYTRRGKSTLKFAPAIANKAAPTSGELSAGTDLTLNTADIAGFTYNNSPINTPDLSSTFTSQIGGEDTADVSSLTFYDDDASSTVRTALAKGVTGFIVRMPYGQVTAKRAEVFPVTVTGANDEWSLGNDPARFVVSFAITSTPVQSAVLP